MLDLSGEECLHNAPSALLTLLIQISWGLNYKWGFACMRMRACMVLYWQYWKIKGVYIIVQSTQKLKYSVAAARHLAKLHKPGRSHKSNRNSGSTSFHSFDLHPLSYFIQFDCGDFKRDLSYVSKPKDFGLCRIYWCRYEVVKIDQGLVLHYSPCHKCVCFNWKV